MIIRLIELMDSPEGWGRAEGRVVFQKLIDIVEANPGVMVYRISLEGVKRVDISFASETIVELARRYRGHKGFCFFDLTDADMRENWEAAAERKKQPLMVWSGSQGWPIGPKPTSGSSDAFEFALQKSSVRAAEYAEARENMAIPNASMKFKQLWEQGFLLRRDGSADTGGIEYSYHRIS